MSQTTQSSNGLSVGPTEGLSLLERAWEVHWALRLACGVLFLDMALLLRTGNGLMTWSASREGILQDLAFLTIVLAAFALVMSLIVPWLSAIARWIGWEVIMGLPRFLRSSEEYPHRPPGYVTACELLELALRENNSFLLDWYHRHVARRNEQDIAMQTLGDLVFGCWVLVSLDWALPLMVTGGDSLIGSVIGALQGHIALVAMAIVVGSFVLLKHAWFPAYRTHWIFYPPLELALREKGRKVRDPR